MMRRGRRETCRSRCLGIALLVTLGATSWLDAADDPDLKEVEKYAPILWLALDEPALPVIPHPFAFDGIDNDGDGCVDVSDPDEVRMEWSTIREAERAGDHTLPACEVNAAPTCRDQLTFPKAPTCWTLEESDRTVQARVLYRSPFDFAMGPERVKALHATGSPRSKGGDASNGYGPRSLSPHLKDRRIRAFQYWLYYSFDLGPNGHPHDGEHVAVFVEDAGDVAQAKVKGMVGAGHEGFNVNNILVAGTLRSEALFPLELRPHTPVLVELGKHSSAPDRNCNGRFDRGFDANLYPEAAWGSRDVWAGNVGQALKVGNFQDWFSYSRSTENVLVHTGYLRPDDETGDSYSLACAGFDPRISALIEDRVAKTYGLFPISLLEEMYERVLPNATSPEVVNAFLREHKAEFWQGITNPTVDVSPAALEEMRSWLKTPTPLREVWLHEAYKKPNDDFREWLFDRMGLGFSVKVDGGNLVPGVSLRVSEVRLPKWLPLGLGGSQALHDSRIEAYAHVDSLGDDNSVCHSGPCLYDAGVDVFSGRGRLGGTYAGVTWNKSYHALQWWQYFGLSAGFEASLPSLGHGALQRWGVSVMLGASAQLFRPTRADVAAAGPGATNEVSAVRALVQFRLTRSFLRPRHALSY